MRHDLELARALHVLAVVFWIGGVGFVTTVVIPAIRRDNPPLRRLSAFLRVEGSFAWQARISVAVAGLSGLWLIAGFDAWGRFGAPSYWWMHAMVGVWTIYALMLFVLEPLFMHRLLVRTRRPDRAFRLMEIMHWALLAASLTTIFGAVAGAHGFILAR